MGLLLSLACRSLKDSPRGRIQRSLGVRVMVVVFAMVNSAGVKKPLVVSAKRDSLELSAMVVMLTVEPSASQPNKCLVGG